QPGFIRYGRIAALMLHNEVGISNLLVPEQKIQATPLRDPWPHVPSRDRRQLSSKNARCSLNCSYKQPVCSPLLSIQSKEESQPTWICPKGDQTLVQGTVTWTIELDP